MNYLDYALFAMFGILLILSILSRNKVAQEKKEALKKLEKARGELEAVYSEINSTQEELNARYREIKASDEKIKKLAYEDSLTGMPNKAAFCEMLRHTLETLRKNEFAGIMYLDLDHFKKLDDLFGHANGDELILDVSHRLRQNLDENDYIARMDGDGDGFMILSQNLKGESEFDEKIKRLIAAFRFPFIASFGEVMITLSIGATMAPADGEKVDGLLKNASLALAEAKRTGKDTYIYYSDELTEREVENIELKSGLLTAIKNNEFKIKYEPILSLKNQTSDLLRLRLLLDRKEKGEVNANRFIHIVENMGFANKVGLYSTHRICEDLKLFPEKNIIIPLTEKMLFDFHFMRQFIKIIEENGVDQKKILFEVEEKILTKTFSDSLFLMEELREKGFCFVLGNYGSGHSSLDVLRDMKFSYVSVSISKLFYDREEKEAQAYLHMLTNIIKEMGSKLIFTNLTSLEEEERLLGLGEILVSGELYGRYLEAKEVSETKRNETLKDL